MPRDLRVQRLTGRIAGGGLERGRASEVWIGAVAGSCGSPRPSASPRLSCSAPFLAATSSAAGVLDFVRIPRAAKGLTEAKVLRTTVASSDGTSAAVRRELGSLAVPRPVAPTEIVRVLIVVGRGSVAQIVASSPILPIVAHAAPPAFGLTAGPRRAFVSGAAAGVGRPVPHQVPVRASPPSMSIRWPFASSLLGMVMVSTPLSKRARIPLASTVRGRVKDRAKLPYRRS